MINKQKTLKKKVSTSGIGLHTGKKAKISFNPAPANHGFKFQRIDLPGKPIINADANKVFSTVRCTCIGTEKVNISTIEHALSALIGMDLDNVLIEIDNVEVPIMDGSAASFVKMIRKAGIVEQDEDREVFVITEPISYLDKETGSEIIALPSDKFEITTLIDFDSPVLGKQYASLNGKGSYEENIAPSRTFVFLRELEVLLDNNLIKGGDLDNAIVIANKPMKAKELKALAKKLNRKEVKVEKEGILNTIKLHFPNEPARHKLLDLIGDLALVGKRIQGRIVAKKPGHAVNIAFAKLLKKEIQDHRKLRGKPVYDPVVDPIMDLTQIEKILPHRFPFLLVDKIIELTESHVVGIKNVTFNEHFFQGHFQGNPVMPGVLQMEALAQTGGILALSTVEDPENWDTYFLKIDNCKFKNKVVPGDTLILKMKLSAPIRRGIVQMEATAYVGNKIVSEADLTAQIVRRK